MLVKNWMRTKVVTVDANDSIQDAIKLLKEYDIQMLPVIKNGNLVGIVTDRALKRASASDVEFLEIHELLNLTSKIKVEKIMTKDPITVPFDYTVEEATEVLLANKISGVPVVDHKGKMVGIINKVDLFNLLSSVTGMGKRGIEFAFMKKRGIQFAFKVKDRPGCIKDLEDIIRKYNGRIRSILSSHEGIPEGYRKVYIRMYGIDRRKLPSLKKEFAEKATLLYMVDHRENKREIYEEQNSKHSSQEAV